MQTLRPYQTETVHAIWDAIEEGYKRILYVLPTGTGKTTTFAELCRTLLMADKRILCVAHRREIITQMHDRIAEHCRLGPFDIGIELGEAHAPLCAKVVCGSVQTVCGANRYLGQFDVIITDECFLLARRLMASLSKRSFPAIPSTHTTTKRRESSARRLYACSKTRSVVL